MAYEHLEPRQKVFVDEYMVDLNATKAAIRAGYAPDYARQIGSQNLSKINIQDAVQERMAARSLRTQITADRVLLEIARSAFVDPASFYDAEGRPLRIPDMPEDARRALIGWEEEALFEGSGRDKIQIGTTRKYKTAKDSSLDKLCRHLSLYKDRGAVPGDQSADAVKADVNDPSVQAIRMFLAAVAGAGSHPSMADGDEKPVDTPKTP